MPITRGHYTAVIAAIGVWLTLASFAAIAAPVDINSASAKALAAAIKGVGPKQAAAIVEYRSANGPFKSIQDLTKVPGVGAKTVANNKDKITVGKSSGGKTAQKKSTKSSKTAAPSGGAVDVNSASAKQLAAAIKGVGPKQAAAIVEYRNANGPFRSLQDLAKVKGIGAKTLEKNAANIGFGGGSRAAAKQAAPASATRTVTPGGAVDVNSASAKELAAAIKGVGPKQAAAIIEYRNANGPFGSLQDLAKVKGIGAKTLEKNAANIGFGGGSRAATRTAAIEVEQSNSELNNFEQSNDEQTATRSTSRRTSKADITGVININRASLEQLQSLKFIGPVKAAAIIEYRELNGPFTTIENITDVSGVGDRTLEENFDRLAVD